MTPYPPTSSESPETGDSIIKSEVISLNDVSNSDSTLSSQSSLDSSQEGEISFLNRDWLFCFSEKTKSKLRLRLRQIITFVLLSSAYAATYLLRKPFGVIKSEVKTEFDIDVNILGWLEFAMFFPYAIISLYFWKLEKIIGARKTLGFGLLLASAATCLMGTARSVWGLFILYFFSGASQSLCWPASCTLLATWFSTKIRNTVVGAFGTTCFFGGASGTFLVVYLNETYGWRGVFLWPSLLVAFRGVVVIVMARKPAYHGLIVPGQEDENGDQYIYDKNQIKTTKEIWNIPLVPEISLSLLCLKIVRYGIMMWFPLYLQVKHDYDLKEAGLTTAAFEAGGLLGSLGLGILLDTVLSGKSLITCSFLVAGSSISLAVLITIMDWGIFIHVILLAIAGALNCGPSIVLAGSAINKIIDPQGSTSAALSVINGTGSIGAALEGPLIAYTVMYAGYQSVVPLLISFSIVATFCLFRAHVVYSRTEKYHRPSSSI